jgi:hypothetical protein
MTKVVAIMSMSLDGYVADEPSVAVRGLQHRELHLDALEPHSPMSCSRSALG